MDKKPFWAEVKGPDDENQVFEGLKGQHEFMKWLDWFIEDQTRKEGLEFHFEVKVTVVRKELST